ncbi:MAG: DUF4249 domain-containing protein [Saprospiraceae bacterium]|nr:DUF4249 domain-containing protein [Saprospiraceae bacterium]
MKNQSLLYICCLVFLNLACEKTIPLDPGQTPELYVIEGLITNETTRQQIKVSKSQGFNDVGVSAGVSGAQVVVTDDQGLIMDFTEAQPGIYKSKTAFAGEIGRTYTLTIEHNDQLFTASEMMNTMGTIDTLLTQIDPEEQADPEEDGRFYDILVFMKEPQETENFYLVKFFRNGQVENFDGEDVYVFDDVAIGEDLSALPGPVYYAEGDVARMELYSLSRKAFRFYSDLNANINNDGGMFSSQPANVSTNMEGGAIGYFQVSAFDEKEVTIK